MRKIVCEPLEKYRELQSTYGTMESVTHWSMPPTVHTLLKEHTYNTCRL